jgi:hypothetical protein
VVSDVGLSLGSSERRAPKIANGPLLSQADGPMTLAGFALMLQVLPSAALAPKSDQVFE